MEQEDIKVFYQYLLSWLFPSQLEFSSTTLAPATTASPHSSPNSGGQSITQSMMSSVKIPAVPHTGR